MIRDRLAFLKCILKPSGSLEALILSSGPGGVFYGLGEQDESLEIVQGRSRAQCAMRPAAVVGSQPGHHGTWSGPGVDTLLLLPAPLAVSLASRSCAEWTFLTRYSLPTT